MENELIKTQASPDAIKRAKERRFGLSASLLTRKQMKVAVVEEPEAAPAWIQLRTKLITLNEASPKTQDAVLALIYDRGKLFHEIGHEVFTKGVLKYRETLAAKARNRAFFLDMSNFLEDGRIERLLGLKWAGTRDYLSALLKTVLKDVGPDPVNGLVLYVRTKLWRNKAEAQFWAPWVKKIDQAVAALSARKVCDIAFEIAEAIAPEPKPAPKQGEGEQVVTQPGEDEQGEQGESGPSPEQEPEQEQEPESGDSADAEGESKNEETEDESEEAEDEGEGESEGEAEEEGESEGESEPTEQSGSGAGGLETLEEDIREAVESIVREARERVADEAGEAYESILEDAATEWEPEQPFAKASEEFIADDLSGLFTSLLVEVNREKRFASREGVLNTLALPKALTNRRCFHQKEPTPSTPYVALLLDTSGSMRGERVALTEAARVLHGSLLKAKVEVLTATFGRSKVTRHALIPTDAFRCQGSTPTGDAMKKANEWLEEKSAMRALMIVVTDGNPNSRKFVMEQKAICEERGGHVLGVILAQWGNNPCWGPEELFSDYVLINKVEELPAALEPKLADFLAGVEKTDASRRN